jgi:hypothetical protein
VPVPETLKPADVKAARLIKIVVEPIADQGRQRECGVIPETHQILFAMRRRLAAPKVSEASLRGCTEASAGALQCRSQR